MSTMVAVVLTVLLVVVAAGLAFLRKVAPAAMLFLIAVAVGVAVALDYYDIVNI